MPQLLDGLDEHVHDLTVIRFPDVGHWVHIDAAQRVNEELLNFLG
jgi:pimeloyl-ACP methyl ester carboxylesterase